MRNLPKEPSLENLRKQAKALLKGYRAGEPEAIQRVHDSHPRGARAGGKKGVSLADAQLVIAREYAFKSWVTLVRHLKLPATDWARAGHVLDQMFQSVPEARGRMLPLREVLEREATALRDAQRAGLSAVAYAIRTTARPAPQWTQVASEIPEADIFGSELDKETARTAIARWHGFSEWSDVLEQGAEMVDPNFEAACDAIVAGDVETLRSLVDEHPALVHARSPFAHHATLLHYVSNNGIEANRQWQTPSNAVEIARVLLKAGADPNAVCDCYGRGTDTPLNLVVASGYAAQAGVQVGLIEILLDYGATINDGLELCMALEFGYSAAAEALARRGAEVDNIVAAAGLGRLDLVKSLVNEDGSLKTDLPLRRVLGVAPAEGPRAYLEQALILACTLGKTTVVEFLLQKGVDTTRRGNQGNTALHSAAWNGHIEVVKLLLAQKAPLEVKNDYGATVLDFTVWASAHNRLGVDYLPIVESLIDAGASVDAVSPFPSGNESVDEVLRRHGAS